MPVAERALRSETINLRASAEQKSLIDRAAKRLGKSRTECVLDTMLDAPVEPGMGLRRTLATPPPWSG